MRVKRNIIKKKKIKWQDLLEDCEKDENIDILAKGCYYLMYVLLNGESLNDT